MPSTLISSTCWMWPSSMVAAIRVGQRARAGSRAAPREIRLAHVRSFGWCAGWSPRVRECRRAGDEGRMSVGGGNAGRRAAARRGSRSHRPLINHIWRRVAGAGCAHAGGPSARRRRGWKRLGARVRQGPALPVIARIWMCSPGRAQRTSVPWRADRDACAHGPLTDPACSAQRLPAAHSDGPMARAGGGEAVRAAGGGRAGIMRLAAAAGAARGPRAGGGRGALRAELRRRPSRSCCACARSRSGTACAGGIEVGDFHQLVLLDVLERLLERHLVRQGDTHHLSAPAERMLVSFFSLNRFTTISLSLAFSPTTWPS